MGAINEDRNGKEEDAARLKRTTRDNINLTAVVNECTRALQCWGERGGSTARRVAPRPTTMASLHSCKPTLKGGRGRHQRRVFFVCAARAVTDAAWARHGPTCDASTFPLRRRCPSALTKRMRRQVFGDMSAEPKSHILSG